MFKPIYQNLFVYRVRKLVELRNRLLNTYQDMKKIVENSTAYQSYDKGDLLNLYLFIDEFKETQYMSSHYLWNIPKKDHNEIIYKEGELTD